MSEEHPSDAKTGTQGDGSADISTPFTPSGDDDSPLGSTDQHSEVDHSKDPADADKAPSDEDPEQEGEESFPASDPPANF